MGRGPASLLAKPALNGSHAVAVSYYPAYFPYPAKPARSSPTFRAVAGFPRRRSRGPARTLRRATTRTQKAWPHPAGKAAGVSGADRGLRGSQNRSQAVERPSLFGLPGESAGLPEICVEGETGFFVYILARDARPAPHEGHAGPRRLGAPLESAMLTWPRDARPRAVPGLVGAIVVIAPVRGLFREPLRRASGSRPRRVSCPRPGLWRARRRGGPRCGPPQAVRPSPRTLQFCTPSSEPS